MNYNTLEFDLLQSALSGKNIIEASAGTGKTYTISRLFLRLVLEKQMPVGKILVVTFTEAATEELRHRIRSLVSDARSAFETGKSADSFLQAMITKCPMQQSKDLLSDALRDFDAAGIFTIHGFCQRILYENAFESGQTFDAQIVKNQLSLLKEIAEDFWRINVYPASALFSCYIVEKKLLPESFLKLLRPFIGPQTIRTVPQISKQDFSEKESAFLSACAATQKSWSSFKPEIIKLLKETNLNKRKYSDGSINDLVASMEEFAKIKIMSPKVFENFEKLSSKTITAALNKNGVFQGHDFFDSCEKLSDISLDLINAFDRQLLYLRSLFLFYTNQELTIRKEQQNILYFDDLLANVSKALENNQKSFELIQTLQNTYTAALIDEFQDTDPLQYGIFNSIFGKSSILFLIGDPKQAIYSFRGADIFAYLKASKTIENRYTLTRNYRSTPRLLDAINILFSHSANPFVFDAIKYNTIYPAIPSKVIEKSLLDNEASFTLWTVKRRDQESLESLSVVQSQEAICAAIAFEVSRLLSHENVVQPSDIAVLVRKNKEAQIIQNAFSRYAIPSILESSGSVFNSPEALDLQRLLQGICNWSKPQFVKAALTTCFIEYDATKINNLNTNEKAWDACVSTMNSYHEMWINAGFSPMIRSLMKDSAVRGRIVSYPMGERKLTNIIHLIELIHEEELQQKLSPAKLCAWLASKIIDTDNASEDELLRLESDDNAVRIMTIHKSKGLEFPIVFCPFSWASSQIPANKKFSPLLFHDAHDNFLATLAMGAEEIQDHKVDAETEQLAENVRLLYVALTRAKSKCYCVWGPMRGADTSALSYIFHGENVEVPLVQNLAAKFKTMDDENIHHDLEVIVKKACEGAIALKDLPDTTPVSLTNLCMEIGNLEVKEFLGTVPAPWKVSSFSSLASHQSSPANSIEMGRDFVDKDVVSSNTMAASRISDPNPEGIFAFPKGAAAGVFLHDVLEHTDFSNIDSVETRAMITNTLKSHGIDEVWKSTIEQMLKNVAGVELLPSNTTVRLANIARKECLHELEFYFPLNRVSASDLNKIVLESGKNLNKAMDFEFKDLQFQPTQGFMKGFMDLVFRCNDQYFLVDWKSNFLGNSITDYITNNIQSVMTDASYNFQYHIYITALHTYLLSRMKDYDYDKHFGGVLYLFLRGIDAAKGPEYGVFFDLPPVSIVKKLCEVLIKK